MQLRRDEYDWHYQGWRVLWASTGAVFFGFSSLLVYSFGVFLKPISAEFHWSREAVSIAFRLAALCVALTSPFLGVMLDRMAPTRTILPCFAVFGAGFASLSLVTPHIWHLYAVYVVVGNGTAQLAYSGAIPTWFEKRRGLAIAILLGGSALGATIWPIIVQALISRTTWRAAYAVIGCTVLASALPLAAHVKRRPDSTVSVHKEDGAIGDCPRFRFGSLW
jgi:MFS family permease